MLIAAIHTLVAVLAGELAQCDDPTHEDALRAIVTFRAAAVAEQDDEARQNGELSAMEVAGIMRQ